MTPLFKKLNFKDQASILLINAPDSFQEESRAMSAFTQVIFQVDGVQKPPFALAFALSQKEVDELAALFAEKTEGDAILWIAYPKGSSKRYKCDFNRDTGWQALGAAGFEPVRQVAIDEDWSALRFRRVEFIKTMTRSFAMTEVGKEKTKKKPTE